MQPNLEAHWTWCDILVKHCVARCGGHLGRKHGWLQGAVGGKNRTTLEAVYPEGLCKAWAKDVKKFLDYRNTFQDYYKCERCAMGRAAKSNMEHSFLPGECRYGQWPGGENPRQRKQLEREQRQKDNVFDSFREEALKNPKLMQG